MYTIHHNSLNPSGMHGLLKTSPSFSIDNQNLCFIPSFPNIRAFYSTILFDDFLGYPQHIKSRLNILLNNNHTPYH